MRIDNPKLSGTASGFGIPMGGSASQVLQKVNNTNYNTQWVTVPQIVDNSSSGYIDIGNVRYQWGENPSGVTGERTITFPAAFRDTTYSFVGTVCGVNDIASRTVYTNTPTTSNIKARVTAGGNASGAAFQWMAIGLKP